MKLLQTKEINEKVNAEKKSLIDSGVFIARKVDALREEMLTLQKERHDFIENNQQVINDSLSKLYKEEDALKREIQDLQAKREELLKPLDQEWQKVETIRNKQLAEEIKLAQLDFDILEKQVSLEKLEADTNRRNELSIDKQNQVDKLKKEAKELVERQQEIYDTAKRERQTQNEQYEEKLKAIDKVEAEQQEKSTILEAQENRLKEKESELIIREKHLASQQQSLRAAYEKLKTR